MDDVRRLLFDFETYAAQNLKIKTKDGQLMPFVMNRAQRYLHERLEAQRQKQGFVRAVVIKGRQQGISTYIASRFYWKTTTAMQKSTFEMSCLLIGLAVGIVSERPVPAGWGAARQTSSCIGAKSIIRQTRKNMRKALCRLFR